MMTGEKLAKAIEEIRPDIPVILCTGFSEKLERHEEELAVEKPKNIIAAPIIASIITWTTFFESVQ